MSGRLANRDSTGRQIRVGDVVRVVATPDLPADGQADEMCAAFRYLVGRYKRVVDFDDEGFAMLVFRMPGDAPNELHSVTIEPWLLRVRRPRTV